jgi:hypothetical protein
MSRSVSRSERAPDADGIGIWSRAEIGRRYRAYCRQFRCNPRNIDFELVGTYYRDRLWIMPVIRQIVEGVEKGDPASIEIGVELIEEDAKFAFGKIMKASAANALRRAAASLSEAQKNRIRVRVVGLLAKGIVPHEMRQYARLVKRIGSGPQSATLAELHRHLTAIGPAANPYALRFAHYLVNPKLGPEKGGR